MRDLKGDWKDLFNGFMVALDMRKMFLAFCGIVFTVVLLGGSTAYIGNMRDSDAVTRPTGFLLHEIWNTVADSWQVIFTGSEELPADWKIYVPYSIFFVLLFLTIWSYFGGAISRIAAYEIARDGERIETAKALKFSRKKFWSFFWAPLICAIGFGFFFFCNFLFGAIGGVLEFIPAAGVIGAPLVALLLPLAILSGFIMMLILIGSITGAPLFLPAIAAEGTDSFDAVSRGFSYVYSRPWHYAGYQLVTAIYGKICIGFVILFTIGMCHLGIKAGAAGFDMFGVYDKPSFEKVENASWTLILSKEHQEKEYNWNPLTYAKSAPKRLLSSPCEILLRDPYGRLQNIATNCIVQPDWNQDFTSLTKPAPKTPASEKEAAKWSESRTGQKIGAYILTAWLIVILGMALGYSISYFLTQQTLIYYILRKKVDGIEMNEVFEEVSEEEETLPEPTVPATPPEEKKD